MSRLTFEEKFKLFNSTHEIKFSIFEDRLLFIHSDFISSQVKLDGTGINLMDNTKCLQLQIYLDGGENYFSLFFCKSDYDRLRLYFMKQNFPMYEIPTLTNKEINN